MAQIPPSPSLHSAAGWQPCPRGHCTRDLWDSGGMTELSTDWEPRPKQSKKSLAFHSSQPFPGEMSVFLCPGRLALTEILISASHRSPLP